MIERRRYMGKELPYDYEVEYLESTGTQYIEVSISGSTQVSTSNYRWKMRVSPTEVTGNASSTYNGVMGNNGFPQIGWYPDGWTVGNAGSSTPYKPQVGGIYDIEYSKEYDGSYWVDGNDTGLKRTGNMIQRIFWIMSATTNAKVKVYYWKCYDINGALVYDMIPVSLNNVGYMYDKISGTLYSNAGTGNFVIGPRKKNISNLWNMSNATINVAAGYNASSKIISSDGTLSYTNNSGNSASRIQFKMSASELGLVSGKEYTLKLWVLNNDLSSTADSQIYTNGAYENFRGPSPITKTWVQNLDNDVMIGYLYASDYSNGATFSVRVMVIKGNRTDFDYVPYNKS